MKRKNILTWIGLVLAGALIISCGKKTAAIPPQAAIPEPISDLSYQLDENGVTLSWSPPTRTEQGGRLPPIDNFLVERAVYEISGFCESCPVQYTAVMAIAGDESGGRRQQKITYREERLQPGYVYFYRVITGMGWRVASLPSKPVSFSWQLPVAAPVALHGQAGDQQISLGWQPPIGDLNGKPIVEPLKYQVFRSNGDDNFVLLGSAVAELAFIDRQVENGIGYQYKVRAVRSSGGSGLFSDMVVVVPVDMNPPPAPQGLSVVDTLEGVRLFWEPLVLDDLGGYQILRRFVDSGSATDFEVIGRVAAPVSSFIDKTVKDHETCYYAIRAFDLADPANEGSLSNEIKMKRNR